MSALIVRLLCALLFMLASGAAAQADPFRLTFTAIIGNTNNTDTANVFGEGAGANLAGQTIDGLITVDPAGLNWTGVSGAADYGDFGAGSVSVSFTLNGVTSTTVSTGTIGYYGNRSGGAVSIGADNYLAIAAAGADGMVQQSIGVLFSGTSLFSPFGNDPLPPDAVAAVGSLGAIGHGQGLVVGGITFMSPVQHLDAVITSIAVPEPGGLAVIAIALAGLLTVRRRTTVPQTSDCC